MQLKNKVIVLIISMLFVLLILPLFLIKTAKPHDTMGIMMLLFFIVNPFATIIINLMIGRHIKKLWCIPILFSVMFLLSYWLVLTDIILELIIYASIYLIIGVITIIISSFVSKKK